MTRRDVLESQHEPFADAYYFGPEFLSNRFRDDAATRQASPGSHQTYKSVLEDFDQVEKQVRALFPHMALDRPSPSGEHARA